MIRPDAAEFQSFLILDDSDCDSQFTLDDEIGSSKNPIIMSDNDA